MRNKVVPLIKVGTKAQIIGKLGEWELMCIKDNYYFFFSKERKWHKEYVDEVMEKVKLAEDDISNK